jgi:hypothetical protein
MSSDVRFINCSFSCGAVDNTPRFEGVPHVCLIHYKGRYLTLKCTPMKSLSRPPALSSRWTPVSPLLSVASCPRSSQEAVKPPSSTLVGLRDRAIISILVYTAASAGAVAGLRLGNFYDAGDQWMLHFDEKGGKSREIPVRHDLEQVLDEYIEAAGILEAGKDTPLFRTALRKTEQLTENEMNVVDVCRLLIQADQTKWF